MVISPGHGDLAVRRAGRVLHVRLRRPDQINALTPAMITGIDAALDLSESDPGVEVILLSGEGDRGLCAGGDVKLLWGMSEQESHDFWALEYRLNARLASHPVPIVALMDGIVMGGGMGIAMHDTLRIVTERSRLAMPEVRIGLSPDVGGTHRLALAPGEVGTHLALTGDSVTAADAVFAGLADAMIPSRDLTAFIADLEAQGVASAMAQHAGPPPDASPLVAASEWIDTCYAADSATDILDRLDRRREEGASEAAAAIRRASPTAVAVALGAIRNSREWNDLPRTLAQDLRTSAGLLRHGDLREGIRAQVIDKDRMPNWSPPSAAEVDPASVAAILSGR
jgi:enoyl-CoA hydratase